MSKNQIEWLTPKAIFRSYVTAPVLSVTIEGAGNILTSLDTEIMVKNGKKTKESKRTCCRRNEDCRNPRY